MNKKLFAAVTATAIALSITGSAAASAHPGKGGAGLESLLSSLVSKGTITQSQADAIAKAKDDAVSAGKAIMDSNRAALDAVITSTLGISLDTVKTRLKAGETLSAIAGDKKDALIAGLIAELNKQIDAALAAGKITTAQATEQKTKTSDRVTKMVNSVKEFGKKGDRHGALKKPNNATTTSFKVA